MSAYVERDEGKVLIWFGERWEVICYHDTGNGDLPTHRLREPDFVTNETDMNALVCEWLRGPQGPTGPTGAMGMVGPAGPGLDERTVAEMVQEVVERLWRERGSTSE